jgi:hypothetical protein
MKPRFYMDLLICLMKTGLLVAEKSGNLVIQVQKFRNNCTFNLHL